jgi:hypothetical protein
VLNGQSGLDERAANARPIPNAHTIWEIVLHVSASADLVLARLKGEARTLSPEEDWPVPPATGDANAWQASVHRLAEIHSELIEELAQVDETGLNAPIVPGFSSVYVFALHGLVQHTP